MSKYITGKEIIERKGIQPIEFFNDHIKNGLQPYNQIEQALSPSDILEAVFDYQNLLERGETLTNEDNEAEEIKERIEAANKSLQLVGDTEWEDYDLPGYAPDAQAILNELLNALYLRAEIKGLRSAKAMAAKPIGPEEAHSNKVERECIKIAQQRFWKKDPDLHPREIARTKDIKAIAVKRNGKPYSERRICEWITPHWENHYFGVPKKRLKK